jgi:acyl-CoA hydrolase
MVDLIEAGAVTNRKKRLDNGKSVAAFALGSQRMYDFLDDNPAIDMRPVNYVNNPYIIGQFDNFISVNACLEVDLIGQVCSESIGSLHFSGTGGQLDFVRGANISNGGKSFIAMNSTAKNDSISKIKPILTPGAAVSTGKNDVDYIVTEYGIAHLRGKTAGERAKALIGIAHPKFRDQLLYEARQMHLMV